MSLVRVMPALALVAGACASHAQSVAKGATRGVKAQVSQIDPGVARTVGDQAARGAVMGALSELASAEQRELIGELVDTTSAAAARGIMTALGSEEGRLQQLADRTAANMVGNFGRGLESDATLHEWLVATTHELAASAVYGARDALADVFPECTGASDRRRCIQREVGEVSREAAHGMMVGFLSALRWPLIALVFLAGVLVTLLFTRVVARTHAPERHPHRQA
jgi:hypothetical protein